MPIEFMCPHCRRELATPDAAAGVAGPCPYCGARVTAPTASGQPAILVQPPAGAGPPEGGPPPDWGAPAEQSGDLPPAAGAGEGAPAGEPGAYMPSEYPPAGYGARVAPSGVLDTGAIFSEAWQVVTGNAGLVIGSAAMVLLARLLAALAIVPFMEPTVVPSTHPLPIWNVSPIGQALDSVLALALAPLTLGPLYIIDALLTRGTADFGLIVAGYRRFWSVIGAILLVALSVFVGAFALCVGAFFAATALSLTWMEIVDRGSGAIDAIRNSWNATDGYRLSIFANLLLLAMLQIPGALLCGVGLIVTLPILMAGYVILYREIQGLQGPAL